MEGISGNGEEIYQRLQSDCTSSISRRVNSAIDEAMLANVIDKDTADGLKVTKTGDNFLKYMGTVDGDQENRRE